MKYIFSIFVLAAVLSASAQDAVPQDTIPFELRKQAYIYTLAKKYNDPVIQRMALYNLVALNPNNPAILDSLALIYFDFQQYASSALVSQDAMRLNPDDLFATEVSAVSFENLGVNSRAVTSYEKLYLANNDLTILYKVAFLQLSLKRYQEALNNADIIIESPEAAELKLLFPVDETNKTQEITMKVAALRLKGMIEADKGNKAQAKTYFNEALKMAPEFVVLKEQIADLDKK